MPDGIAACPGWHVHVQVTTDDARVSGTETTTTWNADRWGAPESTFALVQWATSRLENDGGAWEGRLSGVASLPELR